MQRLSILIIEDNDAIAARIGDYLAARDMLVDYADRAGRGVQRAMAGGYDVVILDLSLPDGDGLDVCRRIKATQPRDVPILMLTARDSLADKVVGFEAGTDDYLTKPFALEEVFLRCLALGRRRRLHQSRVTVIGSLKVDPDQRTVEREGRPITLSPTGFDILYAMVEAYPNAVGRSALIQKIWGDDCPESDVLRSHIYTLRNAVDKPFAAKMIKTIHGVGFRLDA
ncbi:response regulator transcription factor [Acanthopleuribacter pedis]|uniref:Response regulator transcription factor n=1 Tax=Acanthopleuribacter pedis TaxID=442870 RepID=A0A8J7QBJ0_9BACT|nr:response regulator transcription factor [Acanthopleuribacter pedis]MBO1322546.1 response regulator transcription factor [Acanthopleuribacter pedis]